MKYNFVYDTDFLENNCTYLSEEEKRVVYATVVGKHNAIFYGYKPERLIEAIKMIASANPFVEMPSPPAYTELCKSNGGIAYLKDFDSWGIVGQQYLYPFSINDKERSTQFIATATENPLNVVVPDMINNFDVIYECKDDVKIKRTSWNLKSSFRHVVDYHHSLHSGKHVTSTELEVNNYWLCNDAFSYLIELTKRNPVTARKVAMVSRSISDCNFDSLTGMGDILYAERLAGVYK